MNPRNILFGALITLLAGCSLAPFYQRPALPTAASYPGVNGATAQATPGIEQLGWRVFFTDTRLRELITQALENNRDLRIALQRVSEARGLYGIQRADRLPGISADAMAVWPQFLALAAIGAAFFAIALTRFRKTISQMA